MKLTSTFKQRLLSLVICFMLFSAPVTLAQEHPFLIIKKDMYQELAARQDNKPWSELKQRSKEIMQSVDPITDGGDLSDKIVQMREVCDAGALLYIIDPDNKEQYKNNIRDYIINWDKLYNHNKYASSWDYCIPLGGAFVLSIIAYDIIYDDLTQVERDSIEVHFEKVANDFFNQKGSMGSHKLNTYGSCGTWYVFKNHTNKAEAIKLYKNRFDSHVQPSGAFNGCIEYGASRFSRYFRLAKYILMDILSFTNQGDWYNYDRAEKLHEWILNSALTPNGEHASFGDSSTKMRQWSPGYYRAGRFTETAGRLWAWRMTMRDYELHPGLINYLFYPVEMPEPLAPFSKIYPDGGAYFVEQNADKSSLYGALCNYKDREGSHAHKDVNAIHLYAYGEHIIRNSGYNGYGKAAAGFTWEDISHEAWTNNTVLINNNNHWAKYGKGIIEGFTQPCFDYACGDDGKVLMPENHLRNLIMVHSQDEQPGYFVLFDELTNVLPSKSINVLSHPNSNTAQTVTDLEEYTWPIKPLNRSSNNTQVSVFLATKPDSVQIGDAPKATYNESFVSKYLHSNYTPNADSSRTIATIIFPYDNTHPKAEMNRLTGTNFSGAQVSLSDKVKDHILAQEHDTLITCQEFKFDANGVIYRTGANENNFFFVRKGTHFLNGIKSTGFTSETDITVYLKNKTGALISKEPHTTVRVFYPDIEQVLLDSVSIDPLNYGDGWLEFDAPFGTYDIELITGTTSVGQESLPTGYNLFQNYPNPFNPITTIQYEIPIKANIQLDIFNITGEKVISLVEELQTAGQHSVTWNGKDSKGDTVANGVYLYRIQAGQGFRMVKCLILLK